MKIAIVGSGVAGIGAAWLLSQEHDAVIYAKNDYVGGHAYTTDIPTANLWAAPVVRSSKTRTAP